MRGLGRWSLLLAATALIGSTVGAALPSGSAVAAPARSASPGGACIAATCSWTGASRKVTFSSPTKKSEFHTGKGVPTRRDPLRVHVVGLPDAVHPRVTITSPTGNVRRIGGALTVRAPAPGIWIVTAGRVVTPRVTYVPLVKRTVIQLRPGAGGVIVIDYADSFYNSTMRLDGSEVLENPVPAADARTLQGGTRCGLPGAYALVTRHTRDVTLLLTISSVIVVTKGPHTEEGLLMKRVCGPISRLRNGDIEAWGVNAPLAAIGPSGVLPSGTRTSIVNLPPAGAPVPGGPRIGAGADFHYDSCKGNAGGSITAGAGLRPSWNLKIEWNVRALQKMTATATVGGTLTAGIAANLQAGVSCHWNDPTLLGRDGFSLGTYDIPIGGIFPIFVTPTLNIDAQVTASATAAAHIGAEESVGIHAHATAGWDKLPSLSIGLTKPKYSPLHTLRGGASLTGLFGPTLSFDIDGLGGPQLDVLGNVILATGSRTVACDSPGGPVHPSAALCARVLGGIRATFDALAISKSVGTVDDLFRSPMIRLWAIGGVTPKSPPTYMVSLDTLCANPAVQNGSQNSCPADGTATVGGQAFAYNALVDNNNQSVYPSLWNLIDFPPTTCSAVQVRFGIPDTAGSPGDTAYIQIAQGSKSTILGAPYGTVQTLSAHLSSQPWSLLNSATATGDGIAIDLTATCATPSGFPS